MRLLSWFRRSPAEGQQIASLQTGEIRRMAGSHLFEGSPLAIDATPYIHVPEDTVSDLVRARILRDRKLSELGALRRKHLQQLEQAFIRARREVWDEYRAAEAAAKPPQDVAAA